MKSDSEWIDREMFCLVSRRVKDEVVGEWLLMCARCVDYYSTRKKPRIKKVSSWMFCVCGG